MNRALIIDEVAKRTGVTPRVVRLIWTTALDVIAESIDAGKRVNISPLGTFEQRDNSTRQFRNPRTGESVQPRNPRSVRFTAHRTLINFLNGRRDTVHKYPKGTLTPPDAS